MATQTLLTIDEYFDLPEKPGFFYQLINGRLVEVASPPFAHGAIQFHIGRVLGSLLGEKLPHLMGATNTGFLLNPETECAPDVLLIDRARFESMTAYRGALRGAPDLAIEIVSPSELAQDVEEKVEAYLAAGTKTVWTIWPKHRRVSVHHHTGANYKAGPGHTVDAPDVIPGVQIPVDSLFPPGLP